MTYGCKVYLLGNRALWNNHPVQSFKFPNENFVYLLINSNFTQY